ncbi:MAG: adenosylmethionine decarboxylase [Alphaproteobacteria bacterium]|nr:adenosylmethionine decarboxylase [Alphaproteobacteria bacterium]MCZ6764000.1 adenosylmethionine decarboxylase [Alphaproteobacteria bacterium]
MTEDVTPDYFVTRDGETFAGLHLLLDMWGAAGLTDPDFVETSLRQAAEAAGATVLHTHVHRFGNGGLSGVAVLAESHMSIHTWPERGFAAADIFMCGGCDAYDAAQALRARLAPARDHLTEMRRGRDHDSVSGEAHQAA